MGMDKKSPARRGWRLVVAGDLARPSSGTDPPEELLLHAYLGGMSN